MHCCFNFACKRLSLSCSPWLMLANWCCRGAWGSRTERSCFWMLLLVQMEQEGQLRLLHSEMMLEARSLTQKRCSAYPLDRSGVSAPAEQIHKSLHSASEIRKAGPLCCSSASSPLCSWWSPPKLLQGCRVVLGPWRRCGRRTGSKVPVFLIRTVCSKGGGGQEKHQQLRGWR